MAMFLTDNTERFIGKAKLFILIPIICFGGGKKMLQRKQRDANETKVVAEQKKKKKNWF